MHILSPEMPFLVPETMFLRSEMRILSPEMLILVQNQQCLQPKIDMQLTFQCMVVTRVEMEVQCEHQIR